MNRLEKKIVVVTGAGSGIGRAAAEAFAAEGALVGLLDRDADKVEELATRLGESAAALIADVTDEAAVRRAFQEMRDRFGRLDVLYNCAGVQLHNRDTRAHELEIEVWQRTLGVNLTGFFLCCKHGIALMLEGSGGSVINCASPTAVTGCGAPYTAYSSSKGGVLSLTRVLAIEYAEDNIRVNSIVPGTVRTPLIEELVADPDTEGDLLAGTPIGRLGIPEDLVGMAVFLASDESSFATGATFTVDGGLTIR